MDTFKLDISVLPVSVAGHLKSEFTSYLSEGGVSFEELMLKAGDISWIDIGVTIEIIGSLSAVILTYIKTSGSRKVKIKLSNGDTIDCQGMSAKEIEKLLFAARQIDVSQD